MCGRFTQTAPYPKLADRFGIPIDGPKLKPRYNIAPSQDVAVIIEDNGRRLELMHWGLIPHWAKDTKIGYKMINARAETLREKPSFREPLKSRRCIVPANGFFEWKAESGKKAKTPMYFTAADDDLLGLAGLWETWRTPAGPLLHSFTIITTTANALLKPVHDRMPVILNRGDEGTWLQSDTAMDVLLGMLRPSPDDRLKGTVVGSQVNSPKTDDPSCIETAMLVPP